METQPLKKRKWFWPWQDEEEEAWLGEMALAGWHLSRVDLLGSYTFRYGEPNRVVYRLDYMPAKKGDFQDYLQMFQDAGWEYVGEMSNWRYWRKQAAAGEQIEIFTDAESKVRKYRRLLGFLGLLFVVLLMLGMNLFVNTGNAVERYSGIGLFFRLIQAIYLVLYLVYIYVMVRLALRISQLKKKVV